MPSAYGLVLVVAVVVLSLVVSSRNCSQSPLLRGILPSNLQWVLSLTCVSFLRRIFWFLLCSVLSGGPLNTARVFSLKLPPLCYSARSVPASLASSTSQLWLDNSGHPRRLLGFPNLGHGLENLILFFSASFITSESPHLPYVLILEAPQGCFLCIATSFL